MTTHEQSSSPARTLRAADPAEVLAEARVSLQTIPRDCLILIGHADRRSSPLITCVALEHVLGDRDAVDLEHLMMVMSGHGCTGAFALVLAGSGYDETRTGDEETVRAAARVLLAAAHLLPATFDVPEVRVASAGQSRPVLMHITDDGDHDLLVGPPESLAPIETTLVAAQAVASGTTIPSEDDTGHEALLSARADVLARCRQFPALPMEHTWDRALTALHALRRGSHAPGSAAYVTDCEHVAAFLDTLTDPASVRVFLTQCTQDARLREKISRDGVQTLVSESRLRPQRRVCAGGPWYEALDAMAGILTPQRGKKFSDSRDEARDNLDLLIAILAWWNYRFATSGQRADAVLERSADDPLALLLAEITRIPVAPAWCPTP